MSGDPLLPDVEGKAARKALIDTTHAHMVTILTNAVEFLKTADAEIYLSADEAKAADFVTKRSAQLDNYLDALLKGGLKNERDTLLLVYDKLSPTQQDLDQFFKRLGNDPLGLGYQTKGSLGAILKQWVGIEKGYTIAPQNIGITALATNIDDVFGVARDIIDKSELVPSLKTTIFGWLDDRKRSYKKRIQGRDAVDVHRIVNNELMEELRIVSDHIFFL